MSDVEYRRIKEKLLRNRQLYEDPEFTASARSIRKDGNVSRFIEWKRPKEIYRDPKFIIRDATRFDMHQGELGDCWFVAAVACLACTNEKLFDRLVPSDQTFDDGDYAGIFRFNFWQYDHWEQVIIDDRIPTRNGEPVYASNRLRSEYNECWVSLLEKAYAKLYGSYENIDGGFSNDALVDFTGGISERLDLSKNREKLRPSLYELLVRTSSMASMMCSSIKTKRIREEELPNGLYAGHAYSITKLSTVNRFGITVRLLRLRNPWGRGEWNGAWGDSSREWRNVSEEEKKKIGLLPKSDGEFWISYEDFIDSFDDVDMCHLYPDALTQEVAQDLDKRSWEGTKYHSEWVRGFNAGGSGSDPAHKDLFWTNPQFSLTMNKTDDVDADGKCTMVVSLMQKSSDMSNELFISIQMYKLRAHKPILLNGQNYDERSLFLYKVPDRYFNIREVTLHARVEPGTYVIIPTTYHVNKEGGFFMRIFTEKAADTSILDTPTVIDRPDDTTDTLETLFLKHSGGERRVDAEELKDLLTEHFSGDIQRGFGIEVSRSLITMMDRDKSGLLDFEEFRKMVKELNVWKSAFNGFDSNKSGDIDTYELGKVFEAIGFNLSRAVTSSIIRRYGGKKKRLLFEDFIQCCTKIVVLYGVFAKHTSNQDPGKKKIELPLEEWLAITMLY